MKARLKLNDVLAVEAHGLSYNKSAIILNTDASILFRYVQRRKLEWRGKGANKKSGECEQNSVNSQIKRLGVGIGYIAYHRDKHGLTGQQAIQKYLSSRAKK